MTANENFDPISRSDIPDNYDRRKSYVALVRNKFAGKSIITNGRPDGRP